MRRLLAIQLLIIPPLFCLAAPNMAGQTQSTSPQKAVQTQRQSQGFFDYALARSTLEYRLRRLDGEFAGQHSQPHGRRSLLLVERDNTRPARLCRGDHLFRVALCRKKEIVAASIIAELWNGRVSDRIEIVRRTEQFNQLVELHNQETERLLTASPKTSEQETAGSISKSISQIGQSGSPAAGSTAKSKSTNPRTIESVAVENTDSGTSRLQQSNLLLQRRAEALENSEITSTKIEPDDAPAGRGAPPQRNAQGRIERARCNGNPEPVSPVMMNGWPMCAANSNVMSNYMR